MRFVSPAVESVLRRALSAAPSARYESISSFARAFADAVRLDDELSPTAEATNPFELWSGSLPQPRINDTTHAPVPPHIAPVFGRAG
jgi:hypothetical protein